MKLAGILICFLGLTACEASTASSPTLPIKPMRIVSLDFCSDQFVLKLIDRERILAVSPDAASPFSYMRNTAEGVPTVRPTAEDVLIMQPDLIVRSYGGGPNASAFFERAGIPVINVGWAGDIEGIGHLTLDVAEKLGAPERGRAVVADMTMRLNKIKTRTSKPETLYMTPTGVTTGEGSLVHEMLMAAGLENFQKEPGWRSLPLERLAYHQPDLVAAAFFDSRTNHKDAWSAMGHPIARRQMKDRPTVMLQGAWTSCSGWFLMDAIEALANGGAANDF